MKDVNVHIVYKRRFWGLMLLSMLLMLMPGRWTAGFDHVVSRLVGPVSRQGRNMSLSVTEKLNLSKPRVVPLRAYQYVYNKVLNQQQQLNHLRQINAELSGVRQLFGLDRSKKIVAYITGGDTSNAREILKLDCGFNDGLRVGQIALGAAWYGRPGVEGLTGVKGAGGLKGIKDARSVGDVVGNRGAGGSAVGVDKLYSMCMIGRVVDVGGHSASLQLITDLAFSMPVIIRPRMDRRQNWVANGIMQGQGAGLLAVKMVETSYPVKRGDVVFARSDGELLPANVLIGVVQSCRRDDKDPVLWKIDVQPEVDINSLRDVVVLAGTNNDQ